MLPVTSEARMDAINIFPWNENFNTGIDLIDEQHQVLVQLLNQLASHIVYHSDLPSLGGLLDQLSDYTVYHFQTEEQIWQQYLAQDQQEQAHRQLHDRFVTKIQQLKADTDQNPERLLEEALSFLTHWLASHILQTDRHMAFLVQGLQEGLGMDEAKQQAEHRMSGATRALIDIILAVYSKLTNNAVELMREVVIHRQLASALGESEQRFREIFNAVNDAIFIHDAETGRLIEVNRRMCEMYGLNPEEALSKEVNQLSEGNPPFSATEAAEHIRRAVQEGPQTFDWLARKADGSLFWVEVSLRLAQLSDHPIILALVRDISDRKQAEAQIHSLAYFDPLTGLPNRRLLMDRLHHSMASSVRDRQYGALMMLDLDNFKDLNDSKGHDVGDRLLIEVANRLRTHTRQSDTIARLGGDEFVLVSESLGTDEATAAIQATGIAEKIRQALTQPYQLDEQGLNHYNSPSIGVTLFRGEETSMELLLKQADVAMYHAKDAGRNAVRFFNAAMQTTIDARARLVSGLRNSLQQGELQLYFQPQVDWHGRLIGAEALLRWLPREGEAVSPARFIPLAEETGLILPIGDWVLQQACMQLKRWEQDQRTRELTLAINVSAHQFHQPDFVAMVQQQIQHFAINPSKLKLELTESVVLENIDEVIERMRRLQGLGISFSLDDFGTGFSSLSYLKRLPLAQLKIDQSFVRDISHDQNDAAIVRAILAMSDSLGLQVIAEGVETEEQRAFLLRYGCEEFQGYLFGRPLPLEVWPQRLFMP